MMPTTGTRIVPTPELRNSSSPSSATARPAWCGSRSSASRHGLPASRLVRKRVLLVALILSAACAFSAVMLRVGRTNEGNQFTFIALAVVAFVVLGAIALAPSVYRSRVRIIGKVLVLPTLVFVASFAAYAGAGFVAQAFLWPSGQVVDGDFVVKIWSGPDPSGGTTEIRALYFRGSDVTERLRRYVHHSTRPAVIIYERYESGGEAATYAFDGETFRTLRLTPLYGIPVDPDHQWSPDKTRLVLDVDGLYLFDVARWRVSRLTGEGTPPKELHSVNLAGWSPGSRRFAVIDPGKPPF